MCLIIRGCLTPNGVESKGFRFRGYAVELVGLGSARGGSCRYGYKEMGLGSTEIGLKRRAYPSTEMGLSSGGWAQANLG